MAKMTMKHKAMAYVLSEEFGYNMVDIAALMKVSQSTISNAIKDFKYERKITNLEQELKSARFDLEKLNYKPQLIIPANK